MRAAAVCPVHVGREHEVEDLVRSLVDVRETGAGRIVLVSGPAGAGKSRMVAEAVRLASEMGFARLEGQAAPDAGVPYACFVTAIRRRTRMMDQAQLAELFGGPATLATALLPEVALTLGSTASPRTPEDLNAAVWHLVARLARPGGLLLVLEDLHWADPDSLKLFAYLAQEMDDLPVWLVGTFRSDELHRRHPLEVVLTELTRTRAFVEIPLAPLDAEQVGAMISAIFDGTEVGEEFARAVADRTAGNPFFVEELAKVMVERGDVYQGVDDWERRDLTAIEMPSSVRETLLARARTMEPTAARVLQVAALASDVLDLDVLSAATDVPMEEVEAAIAEGLQLQILVERRESGASPYAFRHALSREAFADELVGPDRRRAHHRVAEATIGVHGDHLDGFAAGLADHFAAAGDDEAAFEQALRAARYAKAAFSLAEADQRFDQALHLLRADDDRRLAVALEASGDDHSEEVSRMQLAFAEEARRMAVARADPVAEARALLPLSANAWLEGDGRTGISLLAEARELLHARDDFQEAWVVRKLTRMLALADQLTLDDPALAEGIALAERANNLVALSGLRGTQMLLEPYGPGFHRRYEESVAAARAAQDLDAEANLTSNRGFIALWCGDFTTSRESLRRASAIFEEISPTYRYPVAGEAWLCALAGDYGGALARAAPLRDSSRPPTRVVALTALAEVAQRRGDDDAADLVDELGSIVTDMGEMQRSVPALAARGRQMLLEDDLAAALPVFWTVMESTVGPSMRGSHWPFAPDLARVLAAEGQGAELARWVESVDRMTRVDDNAHNLASQALCRGHLLVAQSRFHEAVPAFEDAVRRYGAVGCPAREVEGLLGLAEATARSGGTEAAAHVAERAADLARRLGAHVLAGEADRAVADAQARPVLATLLFTDIVGSTESAVSLGDTAWRERLERHHAIVRRELARNGGREIDTAGDGFLVAFDSPAAAIRCATATQDALATAGIPIRAGVHTGECQESGGKLTGLTVHIAARVCQQSEAGEVLVSSTVRELLAGSELGFEPRGTRSLKGIPGEWRLFAVARG